MMSDEDNSTVGQTFDHANAVQSANLSEGRTQSVAGRMFVAVTAGFFFGYMLGMVVAPDVAIAMALGCAMTFGAISVAIMLFRPAPPDEYASGFARSEEEVRQALADIEARKK
ncbi:hypothetical protein ACERZ8_14840 [Tateyamaria armeniaca]|uniref:Uncharacterized protein n=1 Tax=Tateyamaria armeniaca TaxID=2518930 RepID=A0ABW8V131_9RHOB